MQTNSALEKKTANYVYVKLDPMGSSLGLTIRPTLISFDSVRHRTLILWCSVIAIQPAIVLFTKYVVIHSQPVTLSLVVSVNMGCGSSNDKIYRTLRADVLITS